MLFDLRSRRRRTAVRVIYIFLALVMAAGLILVGVGTGTGGGGLLNAFSNNGSGSNSNSAADALVKKQVAQALTQTKANPNSTAAWINLMQARLAQARSGSNYNSSTSAYTVAAKPALQGGVDAWTQYLKASHHNPSITGAGLGKSFYAGLGDFGGMADVYQYIVKQESKLPGVYSCLAFTSYAAGRKQLGDLAAAKAVSLSPKLQRLTLKTTLAGARKTTSTAEQYAIGEC